MASWTVSPETSRSGKFAAAGNPAHGTYFSIVETIVIIESLDLSEHLLGDFFLRLRLTAF
jgi:hypothetical protein